MRSEILRVVMSIILPFAKIEQAEGLLVETFRKLLLKPKRDANYLYDTEVSYFTAT